MRHPLVLRVGYSCYARDKKGHWYAAKIVGVSTDQPVKFLVKFRGFPSSHNELVPKTRIRKNLTKGQIVELNASTTWSGNNAGLDAVNGTWIVDNIIGKKGFVGLREQSQVPLHLGGLGPQPPDVGAQAQLARLAGCRV